MAMFFIIEEKQKAIGEHFGEIKKILDNSKKADIKVFTLGLRNLDFIADIKKTKYEVLLLSDSSKTILPSQKEDEVPEVVETKAETEEEKTVEIGKGVWAFMIGLVLIVSALLYFKVYLHKDDYKEQTAEMSTETEIEPIDPKILVEEMMGDMMGQIIREELTTPSTFEVMSRDTIRIIAGCYDKEDFAQRVVVSLRNKGYPNAFMEKHGERWFVAYDRYHTEEEAHQALKEIREVRGDKGWILK